MQWSQIGSGGISLAFDGVPFLCVRTINFECYQGADIDLKTESKQ